MNRTTRAAAIAALSVGGFTFLMGWFLGFDVFLSGLAGIILGALSAALLFAADARSRTLEGRGEPRFPGAPEHADDDHDDRTDDEDA